MTKVKLKQSDLLVDILLGESRLKKPMAEWTGPKRSFDLIVVSPTPILWKERRGK
jgi:hypothetical protein